MHERLVTSFAMRARAGSTQLQLAEFRALTQACAAVARNAPGAALPDAIDGARLFDLALRHRVGVLVLDALARGIAAVDPATSERLTRHALHLRVRALRQSRRLVQLSRALTAGGIRHLTVKGAALAQQLYGDVAARDCKDIDLLVDPARIDAASAVLTAAGFRRTDDHGTPVDSQGKHRIYHDGEIEVELHSRLTDLAALLALPFEDVWARRAQVPLGGVALDVLSPTDTLLYLCAHGTEHSWFRLKWLQDIARIVATQDAAMVAEAATAGIDRIVIAALRLVDDIFGIAAPYLARAGRDPAVDRLVALAKIALREPAELASTPTLGWLWRRTIGQFVIRRDWGYRAALFRHLLESPRAFDRRPSRRRWLGLPVRLVRLLRAQRSRAIARRAAR